MGQKNSTSTSEISVIDGDDGSSSKTEDVSSRTIDDDSQREKCPALCPAYREIVLECYDKAHGDTAGRIVMRMAQQRDDFRAFMDSLTATQREILIEKLRNYLNDVVQNIDNADEVKELSTCYGSFFVKWKTIGFKPDFFAVSASAIATECVFLGGTATATAPTSTFRAWTTLVGMMFSAVRDGYYAELRRQRKPPAFTCGSIESISSVDQPTDPYNNLTDAVDRSVKESHENENSNRHDSETHFATGTPPRPPPSTHKETRSGASRFAFEATPSNSASNESRPALRREGAFYIRRLPQPYQRSKSAAVINDSNDAERAQLTDRADYLASRERIRQLAAGSSRETTSTGASPSSGNNSPLVGRYQKNVSADYDTKRRNRIDEIVRRHDIHKFISSSQKSASATNLFNPNKIMQDFMNS